MTRCEECGFEYAQVPASELSGALQALGVGYRNALSRAGDGRAVLSARPSPETWSALEYACHVRDVLLAQRDRVLLALVEPCPTFASTYPDQRVSLARYNSENPLVVVEEIAMAARLISRVYAAMTPGQLARTGIYNYPEPMERDLIWVGQHTVHEGRHHLRDIERGLMAI